MVSSAQSVQNGPDRTRGIGLVDFLVSNAIMLILFAMVVSFYCLALSLWYHGQVTMRLSQEASEAMEKMTRGIQGTAGIREARSVITPINGTTADSIDFMDINGVVRRFFFDTSAGEVSYLADISGGTAPEVIATHVIDLSFTRLDRLITIALTLEDTAAGHTIDIPLSTSVRTRN